MSTTLATIYNFGFLETAIASILQSASVNLPVKSCATTSLETPYVTIIAQITPRDGQERECNFGAEVAGVQNKILLPYAWTANIAIEVRTNRLNSSQNNATNQAAVRVALLKWQSLFSTLPYHVIEDFRETGATLSQEADDEIDVSVITYKAAFSVREDAWPAYV